MPVHHMDTEAGPESPLFGTWNPASRSELGISSESESESESSEGGRVKVLTGYAGRNQYFGRGNFGNRPPPRSTFTRKPFHNPKWNGRDPNSRDAYWSTTGPKMEARKLLGYTVELPVVAPASAPPEDKKLVLSLTKERIAEAGTGDWNAKTQLFAQRFMQTEPEPRKQRVVN